MFAAFASAVAVIKSASGAALNVRGGLGGILAYYWIGAVAVATMLYYVGCMANSRGRAALIGMLVAALLTAVINFTISPFTAGGWRLLLAMLVLGVFPGSLVGAMVWRPPGDDH